MKPFIFETMSVCAAFKFFPCVAARSFSAAARLAVVPCCAVDDSCALSCGAAIGDSGLLGWMIAGGGATVRARGARTLEVAGKLTTGASSAGRRSGASSALKVASVAEASGIRGCTIEAVGHGNVGRLRSAQPLTTSARQNSPATAAELGDWEGATRGVSCRDRTGWSVMR
jgi:hypothetical protein